MPSRPKDCKAVHRGKHGSRLDKESTINPEAMDIDTSLDVERATRVSSNLYNVWFEHFYDG